MALRTTVKISIDVTALDGSLFDIEDQAKIEAETMCKNLRENPFITISRAEVGHVEVKHP